MRIIKEKTHNDYCEKAKYKPAEESLKAWMYEARYSIWNNSNEFKAKYRNASVVGSKRVVFNIKGNDFRLIVYIEYKLNIIFIVWFGTHGEYDKIDAKKLNMKANIKILRTEEEYNIACERIYQIIQSSNEAIESGSPKGEELDLLSLLVENYEQENHALGAPNPIKAIKFRMDQMSLKQIDVAPLFGGKTRVSEVLNGKRPLTLKMITLLNRYLGIPIESLIAGNKKYELSTKKQDEVLNVGAINQYYSTSKSLSKSV